LAPGRAGSDITHNTRGRLSSSSHLCLNG
jgi:hypothetical protein